MLQHFRVQAAEFVARDGAVRTGNISTPAEYCPELCEEFRILDRKLKALTGAKNSKKAETQKNKEVRMLRKAAGDALHDEQVAAVGAIEPSLGNASVRARAQLRLLMSSCQHRRFDCRQHVVVTDINDDSDDNADFIRHARSTEDS